MVRYYVEKITLDIAPFRTIIDGVYVNWTSRIVVHGNSRTNGSGRKFTGNFYFTKNRAEVGKYTKRAAGSVDFAWQSLGYDELANFMKLIETGQTWASYDVADQRLKVITYSNQMMISGKILQWFDT